MAVPNTNTFSLQDVVNEVKPLSNDLQACINGANSTKYDSNYYTAPATSLLEFRNYNDGLTQFQMTTQKYTTTSSINCTDTTFTTYWHNGVNTNPRVGDTVYEDSAGTTTHDGRFFGTESFRVCSGDQLVIKVQFNGNVSVTNTQCQP